MKFLVLFVFIAVCVMFSHAGLGGSFSDSLDEEKDSGIHPECAKIDIDAYISSTEDGMDAAFVLRSEDVDVGYADINWSVTKYQGDKTKSQEFQYRMNRVGTGKFENRLPTSHLLSSIGETSGDFIRYYFRYWAVPHDCNDQGFMCQTPIRWVGTAVPTRDEL